MFFLVKRRKISSSIPSVLATVILTVVLVVLGVPHFGFAKPCSCKDIKKIEDTLEMIDKTRRAWYSVLADIYGRGKDAPKNMDEARQRFRENMGWTSTRKVGGLDPDTGDAVIDPQFEQENCESIVNGVKVHEKAHLRYGLSRSIPITFMDPGTLAKVLAKSEIDARNYEETFLKEELKKLKEKCKWKCKCTGDMFETAQDCAKNCPKPSMACIAPTCLEIDPETGKWTGEGY
jgi:hypothetical protein